MKKILTRWRGVLTEGNVINFPRQPSISPEDIQFIIRTEDEAARRLAEVYGNMSSIPLEKLEALDTAIDKLERLLTI